MDYDLSAFGPYQPQQLALFIQKQTQPNYHGPDYQPPLWKLSTPSLASLEQRFATTAQAHKWGGEIIISGDEARAIFDTFDQDPWSGLQLFKEGETEYGVAIRALLPYETTGGSVNDMAHIPSPDTQVLSVTLSCSN